MTDPRIKAGKVCLVSLVVNRGESDGGGTWQCSHKVKRKNMKNKILKIIHMSLYNSKLKMENEIKFKYGI